MEFRCVIGQSCEFPNNLLYFGLILYSTYGFCNLRSWNGTWGIFTGHSLMVEGINFLLKYDSLPLVGGFLDTQLNSKHKVIFTILPFSPTPIYFFLGAVVPLG